MTERSQKLLKTGAMRLKIKKVPMRRCVGCMESKPKSSLIRIACYEGKVSIDPAGKAKGRGVYVCRDMECMARARKKRAFQRSFGVNVSDEDMDAVFRELENYEK